MHDLQDEPPPTLEYATPRRRPPSGGWGADDLLAAGRRVLFAVGCAMLVFGLADTFQRGDRDGLYIAAWGAGFFGLTMPWPRQG